MVRVSPQISAYIRAQVAGTLTDTVVIQRESLSHSSSGNVSRVWLDLVTTTGRLLPDQRRNDREAIADREATIEYRRLILTYTESVATGDRVVVNGVTYEVATVLDDYTDKVYVELDVRRVSGL